LAPSSATASLTQSIKVLVTQCRRLLHGPLSSVTGHLARRRRSPLRMKITSRARPHHCPHHGLQHPHRHYRLRMCLPNRWPRGKWLYLDPGSLIVSGVSNTLCKQGGRTPCNTLDPPIPTRGTLITCPSRSCTTSRRVGTSGAQGGWRTCPDQGSGSIREGRSSCRRTQRSTACGNSRAPVSFTAMTIAKGSFSSAILASARLCRREPSLALVRTGTTRSRSCATGWMANATSSPSTRSWT